MSAPAAARPDPRFAIQRVDHDAWVRATAASAAADHLAGSRSLVESFLDTRAEPELAELAAGVREWSRERLADYARRTRGESLAFLVLMLTGACNADCPICFTDRRAKRGELTPEERDGVLRQARALGARYVYVPGEGEPTIDRGFWRMLETCREIGLEAIVFTNAILLSDAASCRRRWGFEPDEAIARLRELPVSLYVKYWTADQRLAAEMLAVRPDRLPYDDHAGTPVPRGLARLLEGLPRERVGIEVVVERRNGDEVADRIVPFAEEHGIARIVEMIQHNGRVLGDRSYDPTREQRLRVARLLSPTSCAMATCKAVVTSRGYLSPRIAVLEHQLPLERVDVRGGDLYERLHRTPYVVERRYDIATCLCERIPAELSGRRLPVAEESPNVVPPALAGCAERHAR